MRVFILLGEMQDLHLLRDLRTTVGELAFLGDLRGTRIYEDLYWGVQNLVDSYWRGMTENLQLGGKYLCGEKVH